MFYLCNICYQINKFALPTTHFSVNHIVQSRYAYSTQFLNPSIKNFFPPFFSCIFWNPMYSHIIPPRVHSTFHSILSGIWKQVCPTTICSRIQTQVLKLRPSMPKVCYQYQYRREWQRGKHSFNLNLNGNSPLLWLNMHSESTICG